MRAIFVNEKFKEDTDPIRDMGIGRFNKKFIQSEIKKLRGTIDEESIEEFVADLAQNEYDAAFEIYLDYKDKEEFYFLFILMGKKRIKVIGFDISDFEGFGDRYTQMYNKKIQPWINKDWTEWHVEENNEYYEHILIKYDS